MSDLHQASYASVSEFLWVSTVNWTDSWSELIIRMTVNVTETVFIVRAFVSERACCFVKDLWWCGWWIETNLLVQSNFVRWKLQSKCFSFVYSVPLTALRPVLIDSFLIGLFEWSRVDDECWTIDQNREYSVRYSREPAPAVSYLHVGFRTGFWKQYRVVFLWLNAQIHLRSRFIRTVKASNFAPCGKCLHFSVKKVC